MIQCSNSIVMPKVMGTSSHVHCRPFPLASRTGDTGFPDQGLPEGQAIDMYNDNSVITNVMPKVMGTSSHVHCRTFPLASRTGDTRFSGLGLLVSSEPGIRKRGFSRKWKSKIAEKIFFAGKNRQAHFFFLWKLRWLIFECKLKHTPGSP